MANVDIVIRAVDQAKAGFKSIIDNLRGVGDSADIAQKKAAIFAAVWGSTTALIVDSYKAYSDLAESIRDLSLVSGKSAESTSRFIQVLDDYQLTAEDATAAAKKLKENGLSPTIETLAQLSDQFRGIQDPAERMDFVYDKLGKSGAKYVNMLNQGSEALLANAAAINKNLVMSDLEIKMYEVGRLAIDEKKDALEGFRVELGQNVGNVLAFAKAMERAYEIQGESTKQFRGSTVTTKDFSEALNEAIAEQLKAADASAEYKYNLEEQAKVLKEVSQANAELVSGAISITSRNEDFAKSQQDILDNIAETRAEGEKLYPWESEKIAENQAKLEELGQSYFDNLEDFKAAMQEKFTLYAVEQIAMSDGVAGFSEAEYEKARVILETTDVATAAAFEEQQAMATLAKAVSDGTAPVEEWGAILDKVMADGVVSVAEVQAAIDAVPKENTVTFNVQTLGGFDMGTAGYDHIAHPGRAAGGPVSAGQSYLVGEQGMEVFTPNQSGTITPNSQVGMDAEKIVAAIYSTKMDEAKLSRLIVEGILRESR